MSSPSLRKAKRSDDRPEASEKIIEAVEIVVDDYYEAYDVWGNHVIKDGRPYTFTFNFKNKTVIVQRRDNIMTLDINSPNVACAEGLLT